MKFNTSIIPKEIITAYNMFTSQNNNGWVYMKICKGMYGLKQARIIANLELKNNMARFGYLPVSLAAGLWKHDTNDTIVTLVVNNFCSKYISEANEEHFLNFPPEKKSITDDRKAEKCISISLKCEYIQFSVTLSMPEYVK